MNESTTSSEERIPERPARSRSDMKSPGELLREGRIAQEWSVEDLCAETKLSEKAVEALEENRFNDLSQPIFAGGYYRQCAKVLDIDVELMMNAYAAWGGKKTSSQTATPAAVDVVPQDVTPPNWRALGLVGLVVLVLVIGGFMLFAPDTDVADESGAASQSAGLSEDDGENGAGATIGSGNSSATSSGRPARPSSRDSGTSLRVSPGPSGASSSAAQAGANTNTQPSTGQRAGGRNVNDSLGINREAERQASQAPAEPEVAPNHLVINFTDRSWVDIRDASGSRLLTGIYDAGDTREFDAEAPYRITLGYAPGVDMTIGGESVDIESQTTGNSTARLTVEARDS